LKAVNALARVAVPSAVVTLTDFTPATCGGVTAVTEVALTTVTAVAATPPIMTEVAPVRFVPVSVMVVPPVVGPEFGETVVNVGGAISGERGDGIADATPSALFAMTAAAAMRAAAARDTLEALIGKRVQPCISLLLERS
jgi:hypothetical protein